MKNIKWANIIIAVICIAAGLLLLVYPSASADFICTLLGIALIVWGIIRIISYLMLSAREALFRNDFTTGVILVLLGILIIHYKELFEQIIPFLLSIGIVASGFSKLQDCIDASRIGAKKSWVYLALALVSVIFGFVIMFHLVESTKLLYQVIGAALLYSGATDLYFSIYLSGQIRKLLKKADGTVIDAESRTVDEQTVDSTAEEETEKSEEKQ